MSLLASQPGLLQALAGEMTPKFLASRSADGIPNVVPCTSITAAGDVEDRLILGNFLLRKSVRNLDSDPRVSVLVITTELEGWILQGDFEGWQRSGPYVDRLNSSDLLRYNAYTGIRNAGIIQVRRVLRAFRLPKTRVLADYLLARAVRPPALPAGAVEVPLAVRRSFQPMTAVRVLAFIGRDSYPLTVPALSLQPAGERAMRCAVKECADLLEPLPAGAAVAASLLTLDVISFQVKGMWLGSRRLGGALTGSMAITSVYAGGPPIPGQQVA